MHGTLAGVHVEHDAVGLLVPEIDRQQAEDKQVAFRADAAFAKPEIYEAPEARGVEYAIPIPANASKYPGTGSLQSVPRRRGLR